MIDEARGMRETTEQTDAMKIELLLLKIHLRSFIRPVLAYGTLVDLPLCVDFLVDWFGWGSIFRFFFFLLIAKNTDDRLDWNSPHLLFILSIYYSNPILYRIR